MLFSTSSPGWVSITKAREKAHSKSLFSFSIGWATDLKTVSPEMIRKRALRTGDGSHECATQKVIGLDDAQNNVERDVEHFWGWNDELLTEEDKKDVTIINKTGD